MVIDLMSAGIYLHTVLGYFQVFLGSSLRRVSFFGRENETRGNKTRQPAIGSLLLSQYLLPIPSRPIFTLLPVSTPSHFVMTVLPAKPRPHKVSSSRHPSTYAVLRYSTAQPFPCPYIYSYLEMPIFLKKLKSQPFLPLSKVQRFNDSACWYPVSRLTWQQRKKKKLEH